MVRQDTLNKRLIAIVVLNIFSSILHYVHNVMYFSHYPEPDWLSPQLVDYFWFFMTPIGIYGLVLALKTKRAKGGWWLYAYAAMGLLSLLHYNIETDNVMTVTMHSFIWFQAIAALILIVYVQRYFKKQATRSA